MKSLPKDVLEVAFKYRIKRYKFSEWPAVYQKLLDAEKLYLEFQKFLRDNMVTIERCPHVKKRFAEQEFILKLEFMIAWSDFYGNDAAKELEQFYKKDILQWNELTPILL